MDCWRDTFLHHISVRSPHPLTNIIAAIRSIEIEYITLGEITEVQQIFPSILSCFDIVFVPKGPALISIKIKNIYEYIHARLSGNVLNGGLRPVGAPVPDLDGPRSFMRGERPCTLNSWSRIVFRGCEEGLRRGSPL
jgi:hypothetical protein